MQCIKLDITLQCARKLIHSPGPWGQGGACAYSAPFLLTLFSQLKCNILQWGKGELYFKCLLSFNTVRPRLFCAVSEIQWNLHLCQMLCERRSDVCSSWESVSEHGDWSMVIIPWLDKRQKVENTLSKSQKDNTSKRRKAVKSKSGKVEKMKRQKVENTKS